MIPSLRLRSSRLLLARSTRPLGRPLSSAVVPLFRWNYLPSIHAMESQRQDGWRGGYHQSRWASSSTSSNAHETVEEEDKKEPTKQDATGVAEKDIDKDGTAEDVTASSQPTKHNAEQLEFKAETKQLLDIVTNSLYTDKDVFLRELVSNASDALEKLRHLQASNAVTTIDPEVPLEIRIELDELKSTITITDTGVGMTRDEMISNLGTIASSGSKKFLNELKLQQEGGPTMSAERGIIGKFGVGFYSAFMVGHTVEVRSKSALAEHATVTPKVWSSDNGAGSFEMFDLDESVRQERGSSVVIHLKDTFWQYCDENKIEGILKRYSNFVNFPIFLNGKRVNTIDAIWVNDPKQVEYDTYVDFYKYITNNMDHPIEIIHFRADAPLDVKALFFIPSFHSEKFGMERMGPGVNLYSRKVLIEAKSKDILPDWMRFVKGVVDSEDLPLAISREKAQDSALIAKLRSTLVRKIIAHMTKMAKKDRSKFVDEFYKEYAFFLKEGICQDHEFQGPLSKLLHFETSKNPNKELTSLDEYIARMRPEQKDVYYLCAPTREAALNSPYLEAFEKADVEVLFMYSAIEDFVMANLEKYEGRKLVSIEKSDIDLAELTNAEDDKESKDTKEKDAIYKADRKLSPAEALDFCLWFRKELGEKKISSCTTTERLHSAPAIVTDHESGALRRMMRMVDTRDGNRDYIPLPKQHVEINPSHKIIVGIHDLIKTEPVLARVMAEQVYDNCLISAGLLDDPRGMLPRLNDILMCVVNGATGKNEPFRAGSVDASSEDIAKDSEPDNETATNSTVDATSAAPPKGSSVSEKP